MTLLTMTASEEIGDGFHLTSLPSYRFARGDECDPAASELVHRQYPFTRSEDIAYSADLAAREREESEATGQMDALCDKTTSSPEYTARVLSRTAAIAIARGCDPIAARHDVMDRFESSLISAKRRGYSVHDPADVFGSKRWMRDSAAQAADLYEIMDRLFGGYIDPPDPRSDGMSPAKVQKHRDRLSAVLSKAASSRRIPRAIWSKVPDGSKPEILDPDRLARFCAAASVIPHGNGRWSLYAGNDLEPGSVQEVFFKRVSSNRKKNRRAATVVDSIKVQPEPAPPKETRKPRPSRRKRR